MLREAIALGGGGSALGGGKRHGVSSVLARGTTPRNPRMSARVANFTVRLCCRCCEALSPKSRSPKRPRGGHETPAALAPSGSAAQAPPRPSGRPAGRGAVLSRDRTRPAPVPRSAANVPKGTLSPVFWIFIAPPAAGAACRPAPGANGGHDRVSAARECWRLCHAGQSIGYRLPYRHIGSNDRGESLCGTLLGGSPGCPGFGSRVGTGGGCRLRVIRTAYRPGPRLPGTSDDHAGRDGCRHAA